MSTFSDRVWIVLKTIPPGKVTTYQHLAAAAGNARASRAVGTILHHNPHLRIVPCHRVVKSTGQLGGYAAGAAQKKLLLQQEGVNIPQATVDLSTYLIIPKQYEAN